VSYDGVSVIFRRRSGEVGLVKLTCIKYVDNNILAA
jgi:hypothetical protein